jgi:hypothetical protein
MNPMRLIRRNTGLLQYEQTLVLKVEPFKSDAHSSPYSSYGTPFDKLFGQEWHSTQQKKPFAWEQG